jgi:hypothetical protein
MSPLHIKILLHYYSHADDYAAYIYVAEPDHAKSRAVTEFTEFLVSQGLLSCRFEDIAWAASQASNKHTDGPLFLITDKGRAMVDHLLAVQIPVCKWVQPS